MLKYFFVFCAALILAVAGYFLLLHDDSRPLDPATATGNRSTTVAEENAPTKPEEKPASVDQVPPSDAEAYMTQEDKEEQQRWKVERGYAPGNTRDYFDLTDQELRDLADAGNLLAMQFLASKISITDPGESLKLFEEAAVHGSTMALVTAAETIRFHDLHNLALSQMEGFEPAIESLKYAYVAEMRGDNVSGGVKKWHVIDHFNLDERDAARACAKARALYRSLEEQRLSLLGQQFDNSPSRFGVQSRNSNFDCV